MAKTDKPSASTWRRKDAAYRKQQKERRLANIAKRQEREEARAQAKVEEAAHE